MHTKRHIRKGGKTRKNRGNKKTGKKWVAAIEAAQKKFKETGSIAAARKSFKKQALTNARKLFGSVGQF